MTAQEALDKHLVALFVRLLGAMPDAESRIAMFVRDWECLCEDNDTVLRLCRESEMVGPSVMLLELRGEYAEAYDLLAKAMIDAQRVNNLALFGIFLIRSPSLIRSIFSYSCLSVAAILSAFVCESAS